LLWDQKKKEKKKTREKLIFEYHKKNECHRWNDSR